MRNLILLSALAVAPPALAKAPAAPAPAASSFRALEGAQNFRDAGGYRTASGRVVKSGVLYRSGTLARLTPAGEAAFERLRTASIIDLRTTEERSHDANGTWLRARPGYWARDYSMSLGDLGRVFGDSKNLTPDRVRAAMTQAYRTTVFEQKDSYRVLFAKLIEGKGPVVLNCTAGKDRTGVGTALVLTALGVPYPAVRRDFLLSNAAVNPALLRSGQGSPLGALPPEVAATLAGVDGQYLDATFDQIRRDYGSVNGYLAKELGVGPRQVAQLRQRMLR
jgi:protein-tyrosine phosphatase